MYVEKWWQGKSIGLLLQVKSCLQGILLGGLNLCFAIATNNARIIDFPTINAGWISTDIKGGDNIQITQKAFIKVHLPHFPLPWDGNMQGMRAAVLKEVTFWD